MLWGASDWAKIERVAVVMPARNSKITIVLATRVFGDSIPGDFIEQLRTQTSSLVWVVRSGKDYRHSRGQLGQAQFRLENVELPADWAGALQLNDQVAPR